MAAQEGATSGGLRKDSGSVLDEAQERRVPRAFGRRAPRDGLHGVGLSGAPARPLGRPPPAGVAEWAVRRSEGALGHRDFLGRCRAGRAVCRILNRARSVVACRPMVLESLQRLDELERQISAPKKVATTWY